MVKSYKIKVVKSGPIVEIYEYENPILEGYQDKRKIGRKGTENTSDDEKSENRAKVLSRAKRDVRRLINANIRPYSKFITLTFRENVTDLKSANYEFKKFRQRLEYVLGFKIEYVVVVEFQKRGSIHYHVVIFNLPYIPNSKLKNVWGNGFVKINKIDNVDNVGAYVSKYMTKETDDFRLKGEKMYFSSRGLTKPTILKNESDVIRLVTSLSKVECAYSNNFTNDYNSVSYFQYNFNRKKNNKNFVKTNTSVKGNM